MRRLTYSFVKEQFENEGYALLSKRYVNARTKLKYICPKGHRHSIAYGDFKRGKRCYYCGRLITENSKRLSIEFIRGEFKKEGYILLTMLYKNNRQKLRYICPDGHKYFITWNSWKNGFRCKKCAEKDYIIKYSGENSPNWRGGLSLLGYCPIWKDSSFKEDIIKRDKKKCQNPYCWGKKGHAGRLVPHHIDYNRKNCHPSNLITLCKSCNGRANTNREWHKNFYTNIIKNKIYHNYTIKEV